MTDQGRRYVGLVAELKTLDVSEPTYETLLDELDRIWWSLEWAEREQIESMLLAVDRMAPPSSTSAEAS